MDFVVSDYDKQGTCGRGRTGHRPVDNEDRVDAAAFRSSIRRLIDCSVGAIVVGGSVGKGPLLVDREWEHGGHCARRGEECRSPKESSSDFAYLHRLVEAGAEFGLRVLQGDEPNIAAGLLAGAVGIVPACANYEPATFLRACQAARAGDQAKLARCQERVMCLRSKLVLAGPNWIAGVKASVASLGIGSGRLASPLQPLTDVEKASLRTIDPPKIH